MKNTLKCWVCFLLTAFIATSLLATTYPSNYNGLPGNDFSLEGALDLFKSCNSLEDFENELNASGNTVNNLDLNNNGRIDYLRVVDHADGDLHAIVIQALIQNGISQDVAVIEVKRNRYGEAVVQIVGDEDLYGTAKIVEPYPYDDVVGTDYYDDYYNHYSPTVFVNVWAWPSVRFIFAPRYVVWVSPYYYDHYPVWYSTWSPYPYHDWYSRTVVYHHHYCVAPYYRAPDAHHYYGARRVSAPVIHQRTTNYVTEHGGRSNFDYTKQRNGHVNTPRSSSSEKPAVANRSDRQREQSPTTKPQVAQPQASNQDKQRSPQPETATPDTRQREQSPTTKPQVAQPQASNQDKQRSPQPEKATPDTRQREQSLSTRPSEPQPKAANPSTNNRKQQESAPAAPKVERSTRQVSSPTQEATPRANNSVSNQSRSSQSNIQAPVPSDRKPAAATAAPKTNRAATTSSRTSGGSSAKASTKSSASSQSQKSKG